jgi:gamma-glutamyl-gamma-aminobutyrate hydrolase PuuD
VRRPRIGLTTGIEEAEWGPWRATAAVLGLVYVRAVETAGGRPILLTPSDDSVADTLDILDGLVVTGGGDLHPSVYEADAHPETYPAGLERDRSELALLEGALARDMPVLAVCRGSQILNVARGGDLVQHLPDVVDDDGRHKESPGLFAEHDVRVELESRLGSLLGGEASSVKSHHHQAFGRLGSGLREVAWAEDGVVEAIEDPSARFALGVLWHPEEGEDMRLFHELVQQAAAYAREHAEPK